MKTSLVALAGEIRKGLLISWTYKVNTLVSLLTLGFIFIGIVFFVDGGTFNPEKITSALLGYLVWMYVVSALSDLTYGLRSEISGGTLEQLAMSPAPLPLLLCGRVISNLIITTIQVFLMGTMIRILFNLQIAWRVEALLPLGITLIGVLGVGYLIAGAMLIFKQIESFSNLMNNALAFLNGSFLPISAMPVWLGKVSMTLPSTLGIIVVRAIILEGKNLLDTWQDGSLPALIINSGVYLVVGLGFFMYCQKLAKNRGSLGQY